MNHVLTISLNEIAQDAKDYLEKLEAYTNNPNEDTELELELSLGVLKVHCISTSELIEESYEEPEIVA